MDQQEIKTDILARIRAGKPTPRPLPEVPRYAYPGDPVANFVNKLLEFDGRAIKFKTRREAIAWLGRQPEMDGSKNVIYSSADGVDGNIPEDELTDLHNAHRIETCVTESNLGVGEMGSVWVTDDSLRHAACALLSRRLFVFLDSQGIVGSLHDAYAGLRLADHRYGSFYTGPSATADIEAVHITGAQGPLSLTVMLYNCIDAPCEPQLMTNPDADTSMW